MTDKTDLDILTNAPVTLEVGGERLALTPIRFGEMAAAMKIVKPMLEELPTSADGEIGLIEMLEIGGDRLIELTALLARQPLAWVQALDADDAITLIGALWEINADFFIQRLGPTLTRELSRINDSLAGPKATTPSSSATTTSGPTASGSSSR